MISWTHLDGHDHTSRERICAWLDANGYDPKRVPTDAWAAHDDSTNEFIVEYFAEPRRVDLATGDIPRIHIRRRALAPMRFDAQPQPAP
ncbi:hypothetical protein [Actinoplanes palleronii]|uniref:Uncharacterized protein n=1 Tax=Actinoplanes palleronii TaxID=113570 RepID=A0ABQ4B412_9ACTN|nr:hypothetical protein [Actinoplanes palleronii]GIE65393.1 hypothetical protein Apa02nite_015010 [Actinoplanes palleronii]